MKNSSNPASTFEAQLERIHHAAGVRTQAELAAFLGIRQAEIANARRRSKIPAEWLITLMLVKQILPEWRKLH